jgi:hypothetical protein
MLCKIWGFHCGDYEACWYVLPKRWILQESHGVHSQKTTLFDIRMLPNYQPWLPQFPVSCFSSQSTMRASIAQAMYQRATFGTESFLLIARARLSLSHNTQKNYGAHPASYFICTWGCFPTGKTIGAWCWLLIFVWCEVKNSAAMFTFAYRF